MCRFCFLCCVRFSSALRDIGCGGGRGGTAETAGIEAVRDGGGGGPIVKSVAVEAVAVVVAAASNPVLKVWLLSLLKASLLPEVFVGLAYMAYVQERKTSKGMWPLVSSARCWLSVRRNQHLEGSASTAHRCIPGVCFCILAFWIRDPAVGPAPTLGHSIFFLSSSLVFSPPGLQPKPIVLFETCAGF